MKPFYILFKHNEQNKKTRFSIWKEYDDTKIWDSPALEVIEYYNTRKEAQTGLNNLRKWLNRKECNA